MRMRVALVVLLWGSAGESGVAQESDAVQRVHDISLLTRPVEQHPLKQWASAGNLRLISKEERSGPIEFVPLDSGTLAAAGGAVVGAPGMSLDAVFLKQALEKNVAPESWQSGENTIEVAGDSLIVQQRPAVHDEIERYLAALAAERLRAVLLDVAFLPPEALDGLVAPDGPWLKAGGYVEALRRGGDRAEAFTLTVRNGQTVSSTSGPQQAVLATTEVNQTGSIPVINPSVETIRLGTSIQVDVVPVGGTDWYSIRLRARRVRGEEKPEIRDNPFGPLNLFRLSEQGIDTTMCLTPERAAVAGLLRASGALKGADSYACIARLRPALSALSATSHNAARSAAPSSSSWTLHDVGFLLDVPPVFKPDSSRFPAQPFLTPSALTSLIQTNVSPEAWKTGSAELSSSLSERVLGVEAPPDVQAGVADALRALAAQRARLATVELRELEGPAAQVLAAARIAENGFLLPNGWTEKPNGFIETYRAEISGQLGAPLELRSCETQRFVENVNTVSGGTGFSVISVPSPEIGTAGDGVSLTARAGSLERPGECHLALELERCRAQFDRHASLLIEAEVLPSRDPGAATDRSTEPSRPSSPAAGSLWAPYQIDLPAQEVMHLSEPYALPERRLAILRMEGLSGGRARMVVGSVKIVHPIPIDPAVSRPNAAVMELSVAGRQRPAQQNPIPPLPAVLLKSSRTTQCGQAEPGNAGVSLAGDVPVQFELEQGPQGLVERLNTIHSPSVIQAAPIDPGGRLLVQGEADAVERARGLLRHIESLKARLVRVDVAIVPVTVLEKVAPGKCVSPDLKPDLTSHDFDSAVEVAGSEGAWLSLVGYLGTRLTGESGIQARRLNRMEINQTGILPLRSPEVTQTLEGLSVEVTCALLPGSHDLRLDLHAVRSLADGPPEQRQILGAEVDFETRKEVEVRTAVILPAGSAALLACFEPGDAGGFGPNSKNDLRPESFALLARAHTLGAVESPAGDEEAAPRGIDLKAIDFAGWFSGTVTAALRNASKSTELAERFAISDTFVFFTGTRAEEIDLAAELDRIARQDLKVESIALYPTSLPNSEAAELDASVLAGQEWQRRLAATRGSMCRLTGLSGTPQRLAAVHRKDYVAALFFVSGATETEVRVAPSLELEWTGAGIVMDSKGSGGSFDLHCELAGSPSIDRTTKVRAYALGHGSPILKPPEVDAVNPEVILELPHENVDAWDGPMPEPDGKPILLRAAPDPKSPGQTRAWIGVRRAIAAGR